LFALTTAARLGIIIIPVLFSPILVWGGSGKIKPNLPRSQIVKPTSPEKVGFSYINQRDS